mmetsp:Transcript_5581/g.10552  ORF Transcript_5581/g.10552 Transcript_5581/m.10552 type:complete len:449 (+) Transcript_5581:56-1402(+)
MPLETTMICLDNSEWMRNGDYSPSRMEAMKDAANLVSNSKMQSNPENTVGVMSFAGRNPELLVSPTDDMGKIMSSIHDVKLFGNLSFADGVQVAYLALKHRRNKNGGQRIVLLVGSPIEDDAKTLKKVAGNLKKNNIAVDVVSIGEVEENQTKLEDFVKAVDKDSNSNLVSIPPGTAPADVLMSSPIVNEGMAGFGGSDGGMGGSAPTGGAGAPGDTGASGGMHDEYGGIDPSLDPELAMVMRMSMEEARREQEAAAAATPTASDADAPAAPAALEPLDTPSAPEPLAPEPLSTPAAAPAPQSTGGGAMEDEEAMLAEALALSMNVDEDADSAPAMTAASSSSASSSAPAMDTDGLDEEMQLALQMSMQLDNTETTPAPQAATPTPTAPAPSAAAAPAATPAAPAAAANDPSFMTNLLATLPGVDPSDPLIQAALAQIQAKQEEDAKK